MKRAFSFVAIAPFLLSYASPGAAQLLSEKADGLSRLCTYPGTANVVSGSQIRTLRIGIGENCPFSYPAELPGAPLPPTAQLRAEAVTESVRACTYEQARSTWTLRIDVARPCPLFAGMITQAPISQSAE